MELDKFVSEHPGNDNDPPANEKKLGFTLSYPVHQAAASSGSAIKWKSFSADHTVEFLFTLVWRILNRPLACLFLVVTLLI